MHGEANKLRITKKKNREEMTEANCDNDHDHIPRHPIPVFASIDNHGQHSPANGTAQPYKNHDLSIWP